MPRASCQALDDAALAAALRLSAGAPRADFTIAQLPALPAPSAGDLVPIYHNGQTYQVPFSSFPSTTLIQPTIFNVKNYGAKGDGVTDDTAAILAALAALAALGYGTLFFPPGVYIVSSTIAIGNATGASVSTLTNVSVVGSGCRSAYALSLPQTPIPLVSAASQFSQIKWAGTAPTGSNVTVVKLLGSIDSFAMSGLEISGNNRAGIGLFNWGVNGAQFQNVLVLDCTAAHYFLTSNVGVTTPSNCVYTNCGMVDTVDCGATIGIVCGGLASDVTVLNSAGIATGASFHNTWIGIACWLGRSTGSVGIDLRYMDADAWYGGAIQGQGAAIQLSQNPNLTTFPGPAFFFVPDISCSGNANTTFKTRGAFTYAPGFTGSWVYGWGDNGFPLTGLPPWINGFTCQGQAFGPLTNIGASMQFMGRAGSTVTNTTAETTFTGIAYTLPANSIVDNTLGSQNGAMLRVKAWGAYNTTGSPTLRIRLYMAGVLLADTGAITAVTGAANQPWRFDNDIIVNSATTTLSEAGVAAIGAVMQAVTQVQSTIGLSAGGALTLTAQWSAASASNAVQLGGFTVELLKSQSFA